jgi:hypothetical protein
MSMTSPTATNSHATESWRAPPQIGKGGLSREAGRIAPALPGGPRRPTRCTRSRGEYHRPLEHALHRCDCPATPRRGISRAAGRCRPTVAADIRAHQSTVAVCLFSAGGGSTWGVTTTPEPGRLYTTCGTLTAHGWRCPELLPEKSWKRSDTARCKWHRATATCRQGTPLLWFRGSTLPPVNAENPSRDRLH